MPKGSPPSYLASMPATDQGSPSGRYTLVPRTLIFLIRQDQVLLIKGAPTKRLWANRYNGLGGHIEQGEDVLTAAQRELYEETGLNAPDLRLCGVITIDTGQETGIGIYVLRGEIVHGELRPSAEGTLEWVNCQEILALPLVEDLPHLLPRVLAMQTSQAPFSAHYHYAEDGALIITFFGGAQHG